MKSTAIWMLRHLMIPVAFIWTTGIFSTCSTKVFSEKESPDGMHTFADSELTKLEINPKNAVAYCDTLVARRTREIQKTGYYDPMLYFRDLKQLTMFETKYQNILNNSLDGKMIYLQCASLSGTRNTLVYLRDQNWRKATFGGKDRRKSIDEARRYWFPTDAVREDKEANEPSPEILRPIAKWLFRIYYRGLPIALIMLLLWRVKLKKECEEIFWEYEKMQKPEFNCGFAPLSFFVSLLFWPIILWIDIRSRAKDMLRKTELLSRRINMLYLLSKSDRQLLSIGSKMSLKEFRNYLESIGKVRKHSFVMALAVTLIISATPRVVTPIATAVQFTETTVLSLSPRTDNDVGNVLHRTVHVYAHDTILPLYVVFEPERVLDDIHFLRKQLGRVLSGFVLKECGVPKATNQLRPKLIS